MKRISLLALCAVCTLGLSACGGSSSTTSNTAVNSSTSAANAATSTNSATQTASTSSASGNKVGVPECDDYLEKYESCLNAKVPEAARASLRASFETTRKSWRDAASTPQGKAGLAQACKAARDAAKQALAAYNCSL
jgi:hypothetical protein